jgi:hypothetical protein
LAHDSVIYKEELTSNLESWTLLLQKFDSQHSSSQA